MGFGGIYSNISAYNPYVDPDGDVSAWTALGNQNNGNGSIWQIGYGKDSTQSQSQYFYEYHDPLIQGGYAQNARVLMGAASGSHYYTVLHDNQGSNVFDVELDSVVKFKAPSRMVPTDAQAMGEAHDLNDQMVGGISDPVDFDDTDTWQPTGLSGQWAPMKGAPLNDQQATGGWAQSGVSTDHFKIWDTQCTN